MNQLISVAVHMMNEWTLYLWLGFWPVMLVVEMIILRWRATGPGKPKTISMVARDMGWHMNGMVYLWAMCGTHWWWNGPAWAPVWTAVLTWVILLVLLIVDYFMYRTAQIQTAKDFADGLPMKTYMRSVNGVVHEWPYTNPLRLWWRAPPLWLAVGALAGRILFPQAAI